MYEHFSGGGPEALATAGTEACALLAAGCEMRDAIVSDLLLLAGALPAGALRVAAAHGDGVPPAPGAVALIARPGESPFDFVRREAVRHDRVWVVAPETGGVLQQLQALVGEARWVGCGAEAVRDASSKRQTLLRLAAQGVCTPLAFEREPGVCRWVVKPDDGAGAIATQVHGQRNAACADLARRTREGLQAVLEPWVDGEALSLSLLCDGDRVELVAINRQHLVLDAHGALHLDGIGQQAVSLTDARAAAMRDCAKRVMRAMPGLRGYVGVDVVWHSQRGPVVIEVNPRVTSAYAGLSQRLGRNLAADVLRAHRVDPASTTEAAAYV